MSEEQAQYGEREVKEIVWKGRKMLELPAGAGTVKIGVRKIRAVLDHIIEAKDFVAKNTPKPNL